MNETDICVDEMLSKVETILNSVAQRALKERKICPKSKTKKQKWFYRDRYALRREVIRLGRKMCRSTATYEQRMLLFSKKMELRKMVQLKKTVVRQNILDQLTNLEVNNPEQHWKLAAELKEL